MKLLKFTLLTMLCLFVAACSDDDKKEVTLVDAQNAYNDARGTYKGYVLDGNVPTPVLITLGDDFKIRDLPVTPLLERFLSGAELDKAVASVKERVFQAPTASMAVTGDQVYVVMEPTDWLFTATVGDIKYDVSALLSTAVCYSHNYDKLSVNIVVDELFCNGMKADLSSNKITWLIDEATRQ